MKRMNPRRTALAGSVALLAVGGLLAASAQAAFALPPGPAAAVAAAQVRAGTPAAHQVVTFFEEYRRAVLGTSGEQPSEVRKRFLLPALDHRLDVWAQEHDADPVFRAQNVPVDWSVQQVKEEYGYASVRLTEFWGGGGSQEVWFTVRVRDLRIVELNDQPAF
ncbi:hypothetical protein [Kitasatospora purpeofusca]|uniref:hypothetical protein n=1 Tax=Kitasatospora purpeofusca TaxID=67352 RepID=UPI002A5AB7EB|nr:hypothetical protein [Kitasatospora purpeofusca]MDY0813646.1 hypothetical protein [Kitasatospora purpeofusca]